MSSETSTDPQALQPWQLFTLAGLIGATIVVFMAPPQTPAGVILLSLTIFAAAVVALAAWRAFAPLAVKNAHIVSAPVSGRTRAAVEREKTLVLRTIKELEFDRAMGKISEADFVEMGTRLRARAAGLIRQLDSSAEYRELIEREVARRLGSDRGTAARADTGCPGCGTSNDPDARFCKQCGRNLGAAG